MRRILLALLIALGLSPGLVWRMDPPLPDYTPRLAVAPVALEGGAERLLGPAGPHVTGAWRLTSSHAQFGSYSALIDPGDGTFLAFSDNGAYLRFDKPGSAPRAPEFGQLDLGGEGGKMWRDVEAATRDPLTGRIWIALEGRNEIIRLAPTLTAVASVRPPQMAHWQGNGGPEAMVRLADGRFVVLAESPLEWGAGSRPGLIFAGDPTDGGKPLEFGFSPPSGYWPSDMAQLPDGRVLILLRGIGYLPPRFTAKLAIADPASIKEGTVWPWQEVGTIAAPLPTDNFEGLSIAGGADGGPVTLWLISDSNNAAYLQETLLLRLEWQAPSHPAQVAKR